MVVKVKESYEKTRPVKNNNQPKKYILLGQRNTRYHEKHLSNKKILKEQFHFHLFELEHLIELEHLPEHLIELEHLPEHLIGELIDARTMN